jgi:hypothetical protein
VTAVAKPASGSTERIAGIIFQRIAAQMGAIAVSEKQWDLAYAGWVENPALFPLVEACIDAAVEIEKHLETGQSG